jgi:predicted transposase YdaD
MTAPPTLREPPAPDYGANRRYRDELFRTIFSEPAQFARLYNAINGTEITAADLSAEATLSDPLFIGPRNDVSFLVGSKLVIFMEHQSTVNRNMALRMLVYAARTYEKIVDWDAALSSKQIRIPRPEFYVIYNGTAAAPPVEKIRLAELFETPNNVDPEKVPFTLDLEVTIYNINIGNNPELLARCDALAEFQTFVEILLKYKGETNDFDAAMNAARLECVRRGLLKKYIYKQKTEGDGMTALWEVTEESVRAYERREARKEGREEGREEGIEEGIRKGKEETAIAMKKEGMDTQTIAKITGLTENEVKKL